MIITRNKIKCKDKTNVLNKQSQATAKNGLSFSGTQGTVSVSGGNHSHGGNTEYTDLSHTHDYSIGADGGDGYQYSKGYYRTNLTIGLTTGGASISMNHRHSIPESGNLSMSGSFTPSGDISGDTETRSSNFTEKYWKRIS